MALINIVAKSNKDIYWNTFLKYYSGLNIKDVEIFPIPKELGFDNDSLGISVPNGYSNKENVISELEHLIILFSVEPYNFTFIELYDGIKISPENSNDLFNKLVPF